MIKICPSNPKSTVLSPRDKAHDVLEPNIFFAVRTPDGRGAVIDKTDGTSTVVDFWLPE